MSEEIVILGNLKGVALKEKEVSVRIDALGLGEDTAMALKDKFLPFVIKAEEWRSKADSIIITEEGDKAKMHEAREIRLALKGIRVNLEKERKALKKESLAKGQAIDLIAGTLRTLIEPIEDGLDLKERFDEIKADERKEALKIKRMDELQQYQLAQYPFDLKEATEEEYQVLIATLETARLKKIADDAELERLRLLEIARKDEIARKANLAASRSREMLALGYQHEGADLGEMNDQDYLLLLDAKQTEANEKKMLQELKDLGEQSVQAIIYSISIATLGTTDAIKQSIEMFQLDRDERLKYFYTERANYVTRLLVEKINQLLSKIEIEERQAADMARIEQEKAELVVENIQLQQQAPEIIVDRKPDPIAILSGSEAISKVEAEIEKVAQKTFKHPVPPGPTTDQINSDKVSLVAMAGVIAGLKMPEVQTQAARNVLAGTQQLIEKIRVYLIEKSKTLNQ